MANVSLSLMIFATQPSFVAKTLLNSSIKFVACTSIPFGIIVS